MKRTGIFFIYFQGERLRDFPEALAGILDKDNAVYYDAVYDSPVGLYCLEPVSEELLLRVHTPEMVRRVKLTGDYEGAVYSAAGTVQAVEEIGRGSIDNAFVFVGFGDHHAGRDFYGGRCYFNGAVLALTRLKERGVKRFAIVDTDGHHGDGTRDLVGGDANVLHVCCCDRDYRDRQNNVDVCIPSHTSDEDYLNRFRREFVPRAESFRPEFIFWEYGYDATQGDYADKGLTRDCHIAIARIIKGVADTVCQGRLVAILCGGARRDIASYTVPRIIACLAEMDTG